jgi:AraC-like DNA-binding protein
VDVLSDVIAVMRTGRPHSTRNDLYAPWGLAFPPGEGVGFHVVLQGSCWLIPPRDAPPIALSAGDVVFLRGNGTHGLADSPSTPLTQVSVPRDESQPLQRTNGAGPGPHTVVVCGAYSLDTTRPHPLLAAVPRVIHLPARVGRHPSLRAAVDLLGGELEQPRQGVRAIVPALLDTLLLYILRAWFDEHPAATGWAAALNDPAITAVLSGIHRDPGRHWTVEDLGRRAGLSRAAFARRFTAAVGQPPLTYVTWWRLTTAARLLRDSDSSLRAIARQAGYTSEFAFAAAFKREYGMAPGRYRHASR